MFIMSCVVTVGPRPENPWVIGKDNLTTLAPRLQTGRSQHVLRQCHLYAEIVFHMN